MKENYLIRLLIMDVDGTLTDGKIYMGASGEAVKAFHAKDGYGIVHLLPKLGITPVIITGRKSEILLRRCEELGITHVYQGVEEKTEMLKRVAEALGTDLVHTAYIGDDLNDFEAMKLCGMKACPSDAAAGIREISDFICTMPGGMGAVREFIDYLEILQTGL